jgi:hypothetical protein
VTQRSSNLMGSSAAMIGTLRNKMAVQGRTIQYDLLSAHPLESVRVTIARRATVLPQQYVALGWYLDREGSPFEPHQPTWGRSTVFDEHFSYVGPGDGPGASTLREFAAGGAFFGMRIRMLPFGAGSVPPREIFGAAAFRLRVSLFGKGHRTHDQLIAVKGRLCRAES